MQLRFDETNERIEKAESNSQRRQSPKAPNMRQKGRNLYKHTDEDLDEEDCALHINFNIFG